MIFELFLTSNPYEDRVTPELQRETAAQGVYGEEVLLDLRVARELPETVQHYNRRIGLRPLPRLFTRPLHQGEGYRHSGKGVPGELTRRGLPT
jgi:hypothetical protein